MRRPSLDRRAAPISGWTAAVCLGALAVAAVAQVPLPVPPEQRGRSDAERSGQHDAANIRTIFWNFGMVGDYPRDPANVDLSTFHSAEVPKGSGMNYSDGITPFVLAKVRLRSGIETFIMETGFRERQDISPYRNRVMRFEPRPGYFQADPNINRGRSPAVSNDPRTWPDSWPDRLTDPTDPGWRGSWNGYFGKRASADQESFTVMDDDFYDAFDYRPDARDSTRHGLGLRIEVRGFQWANPQASNVVFWHYDITNEGTTDYNDNIIFGLYMDTGVGGSALSCDGIYESDDDAAFFNRTFDRDVLNLVYTWDKRGHGRDLSGPCGNTGYLGYAYLETPGNPLDAIDNDEDGIVDERRDAGAGQLIVGQDAIRAYVTANYNLERFEHKYGPLANRAPFRQSRWWTGDEDMDWNAELHDTGSDGIFDTNDTGERDSIPTLGESNFDRTDLNESDQIGLTGFKYNRIRQGQGNPDPDVDGIVFYTDSNNWPARLYQKFSDPDSAVRFDPPLAENYNLGFLFASGPFTLPAGKTERFSLALAYGANLDGLRRTVRTVQLIYDANYQFAVPPRTPTLRAEAGDGRVRLTWDDIAERTPDPVSGELDFEGYRIYRSTDPTFLDPRRITTGTGSENLGNGIPIAQFDLVDGKQGFSVQSVEGVSYWLGSDTGITHTWVDSTATNGQQYYYAIAAYDYGGADVNGFYPSENAITASQTLRGGTILPINVVSVRPEPKVAGWVGASTTPTTHVRGNGRGSVAVRVVNSDLVPEGHIFKVAFLADPDSVHAQSYALIDSTTGEVLFNSGKDFDGAGIGPTGAGLLPIVQTQATVEIDSANTGFTATSPTQHRIRNSYLPSAPINQRGIGFPDDITVVFDDAVRDTSIILGNLRVPRPAKFRLFAHTVTGDMQLDFRFNDLDGDGTLSTLAEYFDAAAYDSIGGTARATWRFQIDPASVPSEQPIVPFRLGDVYELKLTKPFGVEDEFIFTANGQRIDAVKAQADFASAPYVVPNPYIGSASFEPQRFAIAGRGERRIEFRNIPLNATLKIYTVRGELVQTLKHDGSTAGFIPWNLRTKDNLDVAPGLYIFQVDGGKVGTSIGKFAIVK